ncbi:uncharacterized protein LOC125592440 [Brassica napus]|uniref:uncharacterized protein LOC125592440 n=1 Tax=Brassica napus TaxID=3708 RepID=UPI00207AAFD8|nr:uncharacterized protein LOC125592440 [Brassica napus]
MVLLSNATYEWRNLRIQDFKSVDEYNSALFKIVSKLKLYGEDITDKDLLEKDLFHLPCNELRPPGSTPLPEANMAAEDKKESKESNHVHYDKPHSSGHGGWRGRGRGQYSSYGRMNSYGRGRGYQPDSGHGRGRSRGISKPQYSTKSVCHRCGMNNHWAKI